MERDSSWTVITLILSTTALRLLKVAQLEQYDLILLDLNLPGIDGLDLLRTLRAEHSETKVLIFLRVHRCLIALLD